MSEQSGVRVQHTAMPGFTAARNDILQRACACGQHSMGGECEECKKKRTGLQPRLENQSEPAAIPHMVHEVLRSPGRPLDPATRALMEPRFGRDFSHVRVHVDATAAKSARAVNALAYNVGRDLVFAPGTYSPRTFMGQRLLAHELTHVVQQDMAGWPAARFSKTRSDPADASEREATAIADRIIRGDLVRVTNSPNALLQGDFGDLAAGIGAGLGVAGLGLGIAALAGAFESKKDATVDRIDIVDSPAGAIGGYPSITSGDLNSPGPFNNPTTGGVNNVHQIHFHLDKGKSSTLTPRRELQRSAWFAGVEDKNPPDKPVPPGFAGPPAPGGFKGVIVGPDGPAPHEIKRPTEDRIVVADAPGAAALTTAQFPFVYRSHFRVTIADPGGTDIARIRYDVGIEKKSAADVPNTENKITPVEKVDMARGKSLK